MIEKEKNNNSLCESHVMSRPVMSRPSLFKTLEEVKEQVEYNLFGQEMKNGGFYIDGLYNEICLIIAEVYVRNPEDSIRIRGADNRVGIVQEVYRALEHEHIEHVADRFREQTGLIKKKTAYLQTALYNVIFEYDAHYTNLVKHDFYNGV